MNTIYNYYIIGENFSDHNFSVYENWQKNLSQTNSTAFITYHILEKVRSCETE